MEDLKVVECIYRVYRRTMVFGTNSHINRTEVISDACMCGSSFHGVRCPHRASWDELFPWYKDRSKIIRRTHTYCTLI